MNLIEDSYCASGVGDGWLPIIATLEEKLDFLGGDEAFTPAQVKEKFGGLRVYLDNKEDTPRLLVDMAYDCISSAEREAARTCEFCGEAGELRKGGWMKTLCDKCDAERNN